MGGEKKKLKPGNETPRPGGFRGASKSRWKAAKNHIKGRNSFSVVYWTGGVAARGGEKNL